MRWIQLPSQETKIENGAALQQLRKRRAGERDVSVVPHWPAADNDSLNDICEPWLIKEGSDQKIHMRPILELNLPQEIKLAAREPCRAHQSGMAPCGVHLSSEMLERDAACVNDMLADVDREEAVVHVAPSRGWEGVKGTRMTHRYLSRFTDLFPMLEVQGRPRQRWESKLRHGSAPPTPLAVALCPRTEDHTPQCPDAVPLRNSSHGLPAASGIFVRFKYYRCTSNVNFKILQQ
ncbi:hypothetical protein C8Q76DRAFT_313073 [Earliella scabrosa]|nr:hypothetical protein C8Q76DRAFT_313073 [Earliella scabrosa]